MPLRPMLLVALACLLVSPTLAVSQTPAEFRKAQLEKCTVTEALDDWRLDFIGIPGDEGPARRTIYTHTPSAFSVTLTFEGTDVTGGRINFEEAITKAVDLRQLTWDGMYSEETVWVKVDTADTSWSTKGNVQAMQVARTDEIFAMGLRGDDTSDHFTDLFFTVLVSDEMTLSIGIGAPETEAAATYALKTNMIDLLADTLGRQEEKLQKKVTENGAECF